MRVKNKILIVSAGMLAPKKRDHILARRQLYLNYGALTLATVLKDKGYIVNLVHGNHSEPEIFVDGLRELGLLPTLHPIMLSLPSYFALSWAQRFCRYLKAWFPLLAIVAGGRWVVGPDPMWLTSKIPEIDLMATGLGETLVSDIVHTSRWPLLQRSEGAAFAPELGGLPPFHIDHKIVHDFELFQPSIEVSRGCAMGCAFCEERAIPLSLLRSEDVLATYMAETIKQYGSKDIRPYFQSSYFLPNSRWAARLLREIEARDCLLNWRCETRVDCLTASTIELLAKAGLRVIDLGLETASPQQLLRMGKTPKPDQYLRKASEVLKNCAAQGIWIKVNILLYAGETHFTVDETVAWLKDHASLIKGISVGPVLIFGTPKHAKPLIAEFEDAGAFVVDSRSAEESGITLIHPSAEIDSVSAEQISLSISRMIMDHKSYYDLKSFSYYPRNYAYCDYERDIKASDPSALPFDASEILVKASLS